MPIDMSEERPFQTESRLARAEAQAEQANFDAARAKGWAKVALVLAVINVAMIFGWLLTHWHDHHS